MNTIENLSPEIRVALRKCAGAFIDMLDLERLAPDATDYAHVYAPERALAGALSSGYLSSACLTHTSE